MTEETKTKLLEEEIIAQSKLIKLLVEFYDHAEISNSVDCDEEILEHLSEKIEKDYDLNMFRKNKKDI